MKAFLDDELIQMAMQAVKDANYKAFLSAKTEHDFQIARAKAMVLDEFQTALQVVLDAGEMARIVRERSERSPDARPSTE